MSTAQIIVIDFNSVAATEKKGIKLVGLMVSGVKEYIQKEQALGSTIFFINGNAYEPHKRQMIERFLEDVGIRGAFVTHGLPSGFDIFISSKAFVFDGEHFPER